MLPKDFETYTRQLMGEERWARYLASFTETTPTSIRLNPYKPCPTDHLAIDGEVAWCRNAYYLSERPNFTLDPLLHAGGYYVQEAGSMFLDHALATYCTPDLFNTTHRALDLCAAPGGKSTLLRSALPSDVLLMSNEPDRRRANILMENMQKQGHPDVIVTNNYPKDYTKASLGFDLILADVPCSGEGMFRKDHGTIDEWSLQGVMKCQALQREIIETIWPYLTPGGLLIYSTCTFNTRENEENVKWIMEHLGAEILPLDTKPEWNITGSLLPDFDAPVYRFIPGVSRGEGLFLAVLRKTDSQYSGHNDTKKGLRHLKVLSDGNPQPTAKGKSFIPAHAEALLTSLPSGKYPTAELSLDDALHYLHHEAIVLPPDSPKGYTLVSYKGLPLGFVKNIGNRANNLYPAEWKIRNL